MKRIEAELGLVLKLQKAGLFFTREDNGDIVVGRSSAALDLGELERRLSSPESPTERAVLGESDEGE